MNLQALVFADLGGPRWPPAAAALEKDRPNDLQSAGHLSYIAVSAPIV